MREALRGEAADLCVINTCTVTAKADKDSLYAVKRSRRDNPGALIVVTGCGAKEAEQIPGANTVIPGTDKKRIISILKQGFPELIGKSCGSSAGEAITSFQGRTRAFLKIQDGCDNFCSFCKVSLVRGAPASKPLEQAAAEARALVANGYGEIVLTGICLGKYRDNGQGLVDVIGSLERIPGLRRIRLSSIEAVYVTAALVEKMRACGKLCPHLHIPLQSGDDGVLRQMNRRYSRGQFLKIVRDLKRRIPGFAFTTDVIVGFPGETEAAFRKTLETIEALNPLKVHVFPFSSREGTRAALFPGQIAREEVKRRAGLMAEAGRRESAVFKEQFLGAEMEVLVEGRFGSRPGYWQGFTGNYIPVLVPSKDQIGNTFRGVMLDSLEGEYMISGTK